MKKILVISPTPTHPQNAGSRVRIFSMIGNLLEMGFDVHIVYVNQEYGADLHQMKAFWGKRLKIVDYCKPARRKSNYSKSRHIVNWLQRKWLKFDPDSYSVDDWYDESLDDVLVAMHKNHQFDIVIVEYVFMSKALECFGNNVLKYIDTIDVFTDRHQLLRDEGVSPNWFSTSAKEEARGLNRSDGVIAINNDEREIFEKMISKPVITIGHLVMLKKMHPPKLKTPKILFVGSHNPMNVRGIKWFIEKVFPKIRDELKQNVELLIAGRVCIELQNSDDYEKLGEVHDISALYQMANVVINPVPFGTGLGIKTVEALGYAKPLVTTSVGGRGLLEHKDNIFLVADTAADFKTCVIQVLSDKKLCAELSENAYKFAKSWNELQTRELVNLFK